MTRAWRSTRTRRATSSPDPLIGQGVLSIPGFEDQLYATGPEQRPGRTHVVGIVSAESAAQQVSWQERRRGPLLRALGSLTERNRRIGAASMTTQNPAALRIDREYSGGRVGVAARAEGFEARFVNELEQACGACALRGECSLAADPLAFDTAFHYAPQRNKLTAALALDSSLNCGDVAQSPSVPKQSA